MVLGHISLSCWSWFWFCCCKSLIIFPVFQRIRTRLYFLILYVVVSVSPLLGCFPFSQFPVQSLIFTPISLLYMPIFHATLVYTCSTARGARLEGGGVSGWLGGILGIVHVYNRVCSLTCQPDSQFRIPSGILFPQGTGKPSSVDPLWIGPCNGDYDLTVYPPPYYHVEVDFGFVAVSP